MTYFNDATLTELQCLYFEEFMSVDIYEEINRLKQLVNEGRATEDNISALRNASLEVEDKHLELIRKLSKKYFNLTDAEALLLGENSLAPWEVIPYKERLLSLFNDDVSSKLKTHHFTKMGPATLEGYYPLETVISVCATVLKTMHEHIRYDILWEYICQNEPKKDFWEQEMCVTDVMSILFIGTHSAKGLLKEHKINVRDLAEMCFYELNLYKDKEAIALYEGLTEIHWLHEENSEPETIAISSYTDILSMSYEVTHDKHTKLKHKHKPS